MMKQAPRLLIAGTGSGCGKTTVVCALLQALKNRNHAVSSFKCGPDYIDPMFHSEIIGAKSTNLDVFFSGKDGVKSTFLRYAEDLNVIEGVMGYYDGLSMDNETASSFHVAKILSAPAVLVVNGKGMALSAAAAVKGFLSFRTPSRVAGVILNHVSPMTYPALKKVIEKECGVQVFGYMPDQEAFRLESRHLGLVTAQEIGNLKEKMQLMAAQAEKSVDIDGLIHLMQNQPPLTAEVRDEPFEASVRIAVAMDQAFCFYYRENLAVLKEMGAEIIPFSPLKDSCLPPCDGLYIGGGYPELYAQRLGENTALLSSLREKISGGLPTIAECGGFMLLCAAIGDFPAAKVIDTPTFNTGKLCRFGYVTLQSEEDNLLFEKGGTAPAHEFHYWDAGNSGKSLTALKPSGRKWACVHASPTLYAGFPHLYFRSCPKSVRRFLAACEKYKTSHLETRKGTS